MVKHIVILLLFVSSQTFAQHKSCNLIRKWIGTDEKNQTGGIEFRKNGKVKLSMMGNELPEADYEVDYTKKPISTKITAHVKGKTLVLYGLVHFMDANTIKWEVFPMAEKRPTAFSKNTTNTVVILRRSK